MNGGAVGLALGGTAVICCVHNREKRRVVEMPFDPSKTSLHLCTCCENLFTEPSDHPMYCSTCRGMNVYELGGPLPDPRGRI
jgi:hypothetical protein